MVCLVLIYIKIVNLDPVLYSEYEKNSVQTLNNKNEWIKGTIGH